MEIFIVWSQTTADDENILFPIELNNSAENGPRANESGNRLEKTLFAILILIPWLAGSQENVMVISSVDS